MSKLRALVASRLATEPTPLLARLREAPERLLTESGIARAADPWQVELLRGDHRRVLMACGRQVGKSTCAAALALREALLRPPSLVLLLSRGLRQSSELFRKAQDIYRGLGSPGGVAQESATRLELASGSRIVSLPGSEISVRGFSSVAMLVIDEAAAVPESLYRSVRPMLAVTSARARIVCLSSPRGRRGWFWNEFSGPAPWHRVVVPAWHVSRIAPEFLREERAALGPLFFDQEYGGVFTEAPDACFLRSDVEAAYTDDPPLFGREPVRLPDGLAEALAGDAGPLFATGDTP